MQKPNLVESNIKHILDYHLNNCKILKYKYKSLIYNSILFIFLVSFVSLILYYKYQGNTKEQRIKRQIKKQEYVLSNMRKYQNAKLQPMTNLPMTNLPMM